MNSADGSSIEKRLADGLYDIILTKEIEKRSSESFRSETEKIDGSELTKAIFNYIGPKIQQHLDGISDDARRIAEANALIDRLQLNASPITKPAKFLGIINDEYSGSSLISKRPMIPLSEFALLTNLPNEPRIGHEIRAELESADSVDIIMSFVMTHGVNYLDNELQDFHNRGGKIRLITTTYMGNSDAEAVIRMARDFGAEIKVSLDKSKDRLHAKSWIFHRNSGFSTAYVGSSNLSHSALNQGNEWNVKISKYTTPELFAKVNASFLELWNKESLLDFDYKEHSEFLKSELRPNQNKDSLPSNIYNFIDVVPRQHQIDMLNDLDREREVFNRHWNLVVAATGTGKTILSALDYKQFSLGNKSRPRLLFIAHKEEILKQALDTFRFVLRDQAFGELFVSGKAPSEWRHVFASIQSLSRLPLNSFTSNHFDYIVVDEFHHAEAKTYRKLLEFVQPTELLALTATPERTDLVNIQESYFDGRIASELRLWDAIDEGLLAPFNYYGIADGTDLSQIKWAKGKYSQNELENVYTGNHARNAIIYNSLIKLVPSVQDARILSFCASQKHAQEMANFFSTRNLKAIAVTSETPSDVRQKSIQDLANGQIQMICAVDIFNEGIDIPEIDTVLFLRPTESPLIFLQQLGRGLRKSASKQDLTVLDFVGAQRAEYKFHKKLEAILGQRNLSTLESFENDFPYLPSGCQITFDKQSKELVLQNLKSQISSKSNFLISLLRDQGLQSITTFMTRNDLEISDLYRGNRTWTTLKQQSGISAGKLSNFEVTLSRRLTNLLFASDPLRNETYRRLLSGELQPFEGRDLQDKVLTSMLFWNLFPDGKGPNGVWLTTYDEGLQLISRNDDLRQEALDILEFALSQCDFVPDKLHGNLSELPIRTHAHYSRSELLAAFGYAQLTEQPIWDFRLKTSRGTSAHVTGVCHIPEQKSDLFFVTLDKSGNTFSQKTAYKDFAISKWLFHWESQNKDSPSTPTGKRYLSHKETGHNLVLAVRARRENTFGTSPFQLLGQGEVESFTGEFPLELSLRMLRPMPNNVIESSPVHSIA